MRNLFIGLVGLVAIVLLGTFVFASLDYSDGNRAGTVSKMSRKGLLFKTHEGQLNLGGMSGDTGSPTSSLWNFSVVGGDKEVVAALDSALLNGRRVKLYYVEKYFKFPWQGDTKYFVRRVEHEGKPQ